MLTFSYDRADIRPAALLTVCMVLATFATLQFLASVTGGMDLSWVGSHL